VLKKNSGYSLLEAMISGAVLSVGLLGVTQLSSTLNGTQSKLQKTKVRLNAEEMLATIASTSAQCLDALRPTGLNQVLTPGAKTTGLSFLKLDPFGVLRTMTVGSLFANYKINDVYMTLNAGTIGIPINNVSTTVHQGKFGITFIDFASGTETFNTEINMTVYLDSAHHILSCGPVYVGNGATLGIDNTGCTSVGGYSESTAGNGGYTLFWDGIKFTCRNTTCPANSMQYGLDASSNAKCYAIPTCIPPTVPIFLDPSKMDNLTGFKCKLLNCPYAYLITAVDSDGFVSYTVSGSTVDSSAGCTTGVSLCGAGKYVGPTGCLDCPNGDCLCPSGKYAGPGGLGCVSCPSGNCTGLATQLK
jgi:Tfp pilus assembly protein PilV